MTTLVLLLRRRLLRLLRAGERIVADVALRLEGVEPSVTPDAPPRSDDLPAHLRDAPAHWLDLVRAHAPALLQPPAPTPGTPVVAHDRPASDKPPGPADVPLPPAAVVAPASERPVGGADTATAPTHPSGLVDGDVASRSAGPWTPRPAPRTGHVRAGRPTRRLSFVGTARPSPRGATIVAVDHAGRQVPPAAAPRGADRAVARTPASDPPTGGAVGSLLPRPLPVEPARRSSRPPMVPTPAGERPAGTASIPDSPAGIDAVRPTPRRAERVEAIGDVDGPAAAPWPPLPPRPGPSASLRLSDLRRGWRAETDRIQEEVGWNGSPSS